MPSDEKHLAMDARFWRGATLVLMLFCLGFIIALIVVVAQQEVLLAEYKVTPCPSGGDSIDLAEPQDPPPFHDLTKAEIINIREYMYQQSSLGLVKSGDVVVNASYIYLAELLPPPKVDVLNYLDRNGPKPPREAMVILFRGDRQDPIIEEYVVGPLPAPANHRPLKRKFFNKPIPFLYRSENKQEALETEKLFAKIDQVAAPLLQESYEAQFTNCEDKCLVFYYYSPCTPAVTGQDIHQSWYWAHHFVEYWVLHPTDFFVLLNLDGSNPETYGVKQVWYAGQLFDSVEHLMDRYTNGNITKSKIPFPKNDNNLFSKMNFRENIYSSKPKQNPEQVEPSGKRYEVQGRHVTYMGWEFSFRMSTSLGPQLWDVRYRGDRIAYELSLQEIAVFYSGQNPGQRFADYLDSFGLLGALSKALVPGADCPESATFISASHALETSEEPRVFDSAFCLFEHNTNTPLRRHHSYEGWQGRYFNGMMDVVLVLRSILTVYNYDYIIDFIFHQNGAVEIKAISTGAILVGTGVGYSGDKYGFRLHNHIIGSMHHHMFNFKVDLDINGPTNRFEIIEIKPEVIADSNWFGGGVTQYNQNKISRTVVETELQAAYKYNFSTPKYLVFYNDMKKNKHGAPKAYRLLVNGMSKNLLTEDFGNEATISWARYQMAVTKRYDDEMHSTSIYSMWDAKDPVVKFQNYLDDDENIVDQDLVAWVTIGTYHIPHTEDLPVTTTVGLHLSFFLLPYNYFDVDPSMNSRNEIRVDVRKDGDGKETAHLDRHGVPFGIECLAEFEDYAKTVADRPKTIVDI